MQFDTRIRSKPIEKAFPFVNRHLLVGIGVSFIVVSVVILGLALWEAYGSVAGKIAMVELPGFHELELKTPGLYAGIYQHRGTGPIPAQALSHLDVRLMTKGTYDDVPVLMNNTGQIFSQFGLQGMPIFSFVIQDPGTYTLSAVYPGAEKGPTVPVMIVPQSAQNVKQTMIVGVAVFALFLVLGIIILVRLNKWFPKPVGGPEK